MPALSPERVLLAVVPLASPLSSTTSAAAGMALFGGFAGTTGLYDFPSSFISGLRPWPSLSGPSGNHPGRARAGSPGSRAWEIPCMRRFSDRAGSADGSRVAPPAMLPSSLFDGVGTPDSVISRLHSPACTYPCPTLRQPPCGRWRMARGRRGSLLLRRRALPSPSPCRFTPARPKTPFYAPYFCPLARCLAALIGSS